MSGSGGCGGSRCPSLLCNAAAASITSTTLSASSRRGDESVMAVVPQGLVSGIAISVLCGVVAGENYLRHNFAGAPLPIGQVGVVLVLKDRKSTRQNSSH